MNFQKKLSITMKIDVGHYFDHKRSIRKNKVLSR